MKNNLYYSSFIFLIWWAFQGKSLISIKIAYKYNLSGVLSTDLFRNILRINNPTSAIICSTSKLDENIFNLQREEVSDLLYKTLEFYADRKEKLVIEWVHFSRDFLKFALDNWAKCICLNNLLPWKDKVNLKKITTPITRVINKDTWWDYFANHTDGLNIDDIYYTHKEKEYSLMHNIILSDVNELWINLISYKNIDNAVNKISKQISFHQDC